MKKRILTIMTALCMMVAPICEPVSEVMQTAATVHAADSGNCGMLLTWTLDDAGTLTISGRGEMKDRPFSSDVKEKIKKVVIQSGVTSIGVSAFETCVNLISVTIPESVTRIWGGAFRGCTSLTSVNIPNRVKAIAYEAFDGCTSLTSVNIPDGVTSIGTWAFCGCTRLTSVTIPDSVTSIGYAAFSGCWRLTSVTIPDSVTGIEDCAFSGCSNLTTVTILNPKCVIFDEKHTFCNAYDNGKIPFTGTIYGYPGSTAQAYAEKYGRTFVALDSTQPAKTLTLSQDTIRLRAEKTYRIPQVKSDLTYVSLNPDIADVTANGLVMALAKGTASIKITDSTGASTVLTVDVVPADTEPYPLGNLNGDDAINAKDATIILIAAARIGTGSATGFTDEQAVSADVNSDGVINAKDATAVLRYAAAVGTGTAGKLTDYI